MNDSNAHKRRIPLWPSKEDGQCTCPEGASCGSPGKHPRVSGWQNYDGAIEAGEPYGIRTGAGIVVIDIDEKNGKNGLANWEAWCRSQGHEPPSTFKVRTPTGGYHLYFTHKGPPIRNGQDKPCKGVDVRGDGGYVVAPGVRIAGRAYEAVKQTSTIEELPAFIANALAKEQPERIEGAAYTCPNEDLPYNLQCGRELIESWPPAISGQGGHTQTFILAGKLRVELGLPPDAALGLLLEWNTRCEPPWSVSELQHKVSEAARRFQGSYVPVRTPLLDALFTRPEAKRASSRRKPSPTHVYTYALDSVAKAPELDANGKIKKRDDSDLINLLWQRPEWAGVLQYDEFAHRPIAVDPPIELDIAKGAVGDFEEDDVTRIRHALRCESISVSQDSARRAARVVAKANGFHPVREYLQELPAPDGNPRAIVEDFVRNAFEHPSPDDIALSAALFLRFVVGAVQRIMQPGYKFDGALVLQGPQGAGKSFAIKRLVPDEKWASEFFADLENKDARIALTGKWLVEIGEMQAAMRKDPETVKNFLSCQVDEFREPYARANIERPRQCVFIGTTNQREILRDPTGERRYWIVPLTRVNLDYVRDNRDRLWSAAVALAKAGEQCFLTTDEGQRLERRQGAYKQRHPWFEDVLAYVKGRTHVTEREIFLRVGGGQIFGRRECDQIKAILTELRWTRKDGGRNHGWHSPGGVPFDAEVDELLSRVDAPSGSPEVNGKPAEALGFP